MAFTRKHFILHRPYLYHFTNAGNAELLRRCREMLCTAAWVLAANQFRPQVEDVDAFLGTARLGPIVLSVRPDCVVTLNDQLPLRNREGFAARRGTYEDFLRCLNGLIFFWPGDEGGPTPKGSLAETFARRYAAFGCLRVPSAGVWAEGEHAAVQFCTCNSGAPQVRDRIERGPHIFVACDDAALRLPKVAEVVFPQRLALPENTQWRGPGERGWRPLFE